MASGEVIGARQRPGGLVGMLWHVLLRWVGLSGAGARVGDEAVLHLDLGPGDRPRAALQVRGRYGGVRLRERVFDLGPPLITRRPWVGSLRVAWSARTWGRRAIALRGRRATWHLGGVRLRVLGMAWIEPWIGIRQLEEGRWDVRLAWRDPTLGVVSWLRLELGALPLEGPSASD